MIANIWFILKTMLSLSLKIWYTSRYKALLAPKGSNVYCKCKPYFAFTLVVYILVYEKTACIRVFKVCLIHLQECLFSRGHVSLKLIRTFNNINIFNEKYWCLTNTK